MLVSVEEAVKGSGDTEHGEATENPRRPSEFGVCVLFVCAV